MLTSPSQQLEDVVLAREAAEVQSSIPGVGDPSSVASSLVLKTPPAKGYVTAGNEFDSYAKPPQPPPPRNQSQPQVPVLDIRRASFSAAGGEKGATADLASEQYLQQQQQRRQPPDVEDDDGTTTTDEEDSVIRCICGFDHDDGFTIQCERCYVWQHGQCVGVAVDSVPNVYLCERCSPRPLDVKKAVELQRRRRREDVDLRGHEGTDREDNRNPTKPAKNQEGKSVKNHESRHRPDTYNLKASENRPDDNHNAHKARDSPPSPKRKLGSKAQNGFRKPCSAAMATNPSPAKGAFGADTDAASRRSGGGTSSTSASVSGSRNRKPPNQQGMHQRRQSGPQASRENNGDATNSGHVEEANHDDDDAMAYQLEYSPLERSLVTSKDANEVFHAVDDKFVFPAQKFDRSLGPPPVPSVLAAGTSVKHISLLMSNDLLGFVVLDRETLTRSLPRVSVKRVPEQRTGVAQDMPALPPAGSRYGLFAETLITAGRYVIDFKGEYLLKSAYMHDPINQYTLLGSPKPHVALLPGPLDLCIDARRFGNVARFVRRSCRPNVEPRGVVCNGLPNAEDKRIPNFDGKGRVVRLGLFAKTEIARGEEITLPWDWDPKQVHVDAEHDEGLGNIGALEDEYTEDAVGNDDARTTRARRKQLALYGSPRARAARAILALSTCACGSPAACRMQRIARGEDVSDCENNPEIDEELFAILLARRGAQAQHGVSERLNQRATGSKHFGSSTSSKGATAIDSDVDIGADDDLHVKQECTADANQDDEDAEDEEEEDRRQSKSSSTSSRNRRKSGSQPRKRTSTFSPPSERHGEQQRQKHPPLSREERKMQEIIARFARMEEEEHAKRDARKSAGGSKKFGDAATSLSRKRNRNPPPLAAGGKASVAATDCGNHNSDHNGNGGVNSHIALAPADVEEDIEVDDAEDERDFARTQAANHASSRRRKASQTKTKKSRSGASSSKRRSSKKGSTTSAVIARATESNDAGILSTSSLSSVSGMSSSEEDDGKPELRRRSAKVERRESLPFDWNNSAGSARRHGWEDRSVEDGRRGFTTSALPDSPPLLPKKFWQRKWMRDHPDWGIRYHANVSDGTRDVSQSKSKRQNEESEEASRAARKKMKVGQSDGRARTPGIGRFEDDRRIAGSNPTKLPAPPEPRKLSFRDYQLQRGVQLSLSPTAYSPVAGSTAAGDMVITESPVPPSTAPLLPTSPSPPTLPPCGVLPQIPVSITLRR